jgi:tetratricopeptide (TPR) repeat protein
VKAIDKKIKSQTVFLSLFCCTFLFTSLFSNSTPLIAEERKTGWKVTRYDIEVSLDPDREYLSEKAKIDVEASSDTHVLNFALNEGLHVLNVMPAFGVVDFRKRGESLMITIDPPLNGKNTLIVELEGKIKSREPDERQAFLEKSIMLLWSDLWYPFAEEAWAKSKIAVTLPRRYRIVGPGREISLKRDQRQKTSIWESDNNSSFYSIMADKRWHIREVDRGAFKIKTYLYPGGGIDFEDRIISSATDVLNYYSKIFYPYPFHQFAFVELEGLYARRALNGFIAYSPEYLRKVYSSEGYDAHETAFLWWGYTIGGKGKGGLQWMEGFGDYAEYLYCEHARLPLTPILQRFRLEYFFLDPKQDKRFSDLDGSASQELIHGKGPAIVEMLRYFVGDKRFFEALKVLFREKRFSSLTLEEFRKIMEKGTGRNLQTFFDEWIYRSGAPRLTMDHKISKTYKEEYRVDLAIRQNKQSYTLPVEILMVGEKKRREEKVEIKGGKSSFFFRYDFEPKKVILDPHNKIFRWQEKFHEQYQNLSTGRRIDQSIQKAAALEKEGDFEAAERIYEDVLKDFPDCMELAYNYARMEQERKDYYKAIDLYERAIKGKPFSGKERGALLPWSYIRMGNILDLLGERQKALKAYKKALKLPDRLNSKRTAEIYTKEPYTEH